MVTLAISEVGGRDRMLETSWEAKLTESVSSGFNKKPCFCEYTESEEDTR